MLHLHYTVPFAVIVANAVTILLAIASRLAVGTATTS